MGYKGLYSYIFQIYLKKGKSERGPTKVIRYHNIRFLKILYPYSDNTYLENVLVNKERLIKVNEDGNIIV